MGQNKKEYNVKLYITKLKHITALVQQITVSIFFLKNIHILPT